MFVMFIKYTDGFKPPASEKLRVKHYAIKKTTKFSFLSLKYPLVKW